MELFIMSKNNLIEIVTYKLVHNALGTQLKKMINTINEQKEIPVHAKQMVKESLVNLHAKLIYLENNDMDGFIKYYRDITPEVYKPERGWVWKNLPQIVEKVFEKEDMGFKVRLNIPSDISSYSELIDTLMELQESLNRILGFHKLMRDIEKFDKFDEFDEFDNLKLNDNIDGMLN